MSGNAGNRRRRSVTASGAATTRASTPLRAAARTASGTFPAVRSSNPGAVAAAACTPPTASTRSRSPVNSAVRIRGAADRWDRGLRRSPGVCGVQLGAAEDAAHAAQRFAHPHPGVVDVVLVDLGVVPGAAHLEHQGGAPHVAL